MDAEVSSGLLRNIFVDGTPLHDGAVIIRNNRIAAACCELPLTSNEEVVRGVGSRHRAAVGITEVSDCVVVGYTSGGVLGEKVGCVVHPNMDLLKARNGGKDVAWEDAVKIAQDKVHAQCQDLADYKRVRKVVVAKEPLQRTSIQKVRRVAYKGTLDE